MAQDELFYLSEEEYVKKYGKDMAKTMLDLDLGFHILVNQIDKSTKKITTYNKKITNLK